MTFVTDCRKQIREVSFHVLYDRRKEKQKDSIKKNNLSAY